MTLCLAHFADLDRTIGGFEGLQAAQDCIASDENGMPSQKISIYYRNYGKRFRLMRF